MSEKPPASDAGQGSVRLPLLRRRTIVLTFLLVAFVGLHPLWLRMLAWPLEANEATLATQFDYLLLHGGEMQVDGKNPLDHAAQWHAESPGRKILLLLPHMSRIVEVGALPSFEQLCRRELAKRGVPAADVESLPADARNEWDEARALDRWLKYNPKATIAFACGRFAGGRLRYACNHTLAHADQGRLLILPLGDERSWNWWQSRNGVKDFMFSWLYLLYAWRGSGAPGPAPPSAAEFQRQVRASIGEAPT